MSRTKRNKPGGNRRANPKQKECKDKPLEQSAPPHRQKPTSNTPQTPSNPPAPKPNQKPTIPFYPDDKILLVGEGDFSFARSLVSSHQCTNVTATCLEATEAELTSKHAASAEHVAFLRDSEQAVVLGVDATKLGSHRRLRDAGPWDKILFNFPHVGGQSTDVNRQVRANQAMLAGFFKAALPLLAEGGGVVVTLFEAEPYTLWNVKDLARSEEFACKRSWRFQAAVYPEYAHARTMGTVKKGGKEGEEVSKSAWKGEERASRSYEFVRKGDGPEPVATAGKRKRGDDSSDDDD